MELYASVCNPVIKDCLSTFPSSKETFNSTFAYCCSVNVIDFPTKTCAVERR